MLVKTTGRKVTLKQSFVDMVEKRMKKFDKFFDDDAEAKVTVTVEKDRQTAEVTVKSKGFFFRAERTAQDMETAFSDAADLLVKQIVRNKEKLGARVKHNAIDDYVMSDLSAEEPDEKESPSDTFEIAREKRFHVERMTVDEAILQMNMLGHSFFLFKDIDTGELNVVYRRHDEAYGLLIPEP